MSHLIQQQSEPVKQLAEMGASAILAMESSIKKEELEEFFIKEANPSKGSLKINYYGYVILFRIEIKLDSTKEGFLSVSSAKLAAYHLNYEAGPKETPKESPLAECNFNVAGDFWASYWGNIGYYTVEQFASYFLAEVFRQALSKGMALRP
ncbi:MAG TPA: hypothetical protein VK731_07510 [Candidatus Cybelea sp.]|nr:hypothetical protein [Candidatus Cybelea sp.]